MKAYMLISVRGSPEITVCIMNSQCTQLAVRLTCSALNLQYT